MKDAPTAGANTGRSAKSLKRRQKELQACLKYKPTEPFKVAQPVVKDFECDLDLVEHWPGMKEWDEKWNHDSKGKRFFDLRKVSRCDPGQADCEDEQATAGNDGAFGAWYDVKNCGKCNDYCRWFGTPPRAADRSPFDHLVINGRRKAHWTCAMSGSEGNTKRGYFSKKHPEVGEPHKRHPAVLTKHRTPFSFVKCSAKGVKTPACHRQQHISPRHLAAMRRKETRAKKGHFAGWYDVQDCGKCGDYCQWFGTPGGYPSKVRINQQHNYHKKKSGAWVVDPKQRPAYWGCYLAGSNDKTARYHFSQFKICKSGKDTQHNCIKRCSDSAAK